MIMLKFCCFPSLAFYLPIMKILIMKFSEDIGKIEAHSEKDSMAVIIAGQNDIEKTLKLKTNFKHKDTVALDHSSYTVFFD